MHRALSSLGMDDQVVARFSGVLQNIEYAVLTVYRNEQDLLDLEVIDAFDALVRRYAAEEQQRTPAKLRLSGRAVLVFRAAEQTCEWRLGRAALNDDDGRTALPAEEWITIADLLPCLKRLRKSAHMWNEQAGRQGYLDFIANFVL